MESGTEHTFHIDGEETHVDLFWSHNRKEHGIWRIKCKIVYGQNKEKTFYETTTDSLFIELVNEMYVEDVPYYEIQKVYFNKFFDKISEDIEEYLIDNI